MAKAVIIGAGFMGSALAWPLADNGHIVNLVGTYLDDEIVKTLKETNVHPKLRRNLPFGVTSWYFRDLDQAFDGADIIVSGVSSLGVDWIAQILSERVHEKQQLLSITKGLRIDNNGEVSLFPDIIKRSLSKELRDSVIPVAVGGPCIAGELAARRQTCVMFGCREIKKAIQCATLFSTDYYHIKPTSDLMSLEIGVAMKNAYAVSIGIAYGMYKHDEAGAEMHNTAAAMFAQSCFEIRELLKLLGGEESQASSLPGAGDLYVTSMGGRTISLGRLLGEGKTYRQAETILKGVTLESVQIIREMARALEIWETKKRISSNAFPLLRMLVDIIVKGKNVDIPFDRFSNSVD